MRGDDGQPVLAPDGHPVPRLWFEGILFLVFLNGSFI
jgi:hypothetical protein